MAVKEKKQTPLWNDTTTYQIFLNKEKDLMKTIARLSNLVDISIGENEIESYAKYLDAPFEWLYKTYWSKYSNFYPPTSDPKSTFIRNAKVTEAEVNGLKVLFDKLYVISLCFITSWTFCVRLIRAFTLAFNSFKLNGFVM